MMKKYLFLSMAAFLVIISFAQTSWADWPITSYPEFRGRVIDADTKEPIEGAVAVVYYMRDMLIGGPGGPGYYILHANECLTDKKGEFQFPSYTSFHILSDGGSSNFIFFKPGYMAISAMVYTINGTDVYVSLHDYLSIGKVGEEKEISGTTKYYGKVVTWKGPAGIVELKRANTYDERRIGGPSTPTDYSSRQLPLLFKAIDDDRRERGLEVR